MTKKYFHQLSEYNIWANAIVCNWLDQITDEQWKHPVVSSFNSVQETVLHLISAEKVWLERLNNTENISWLASTYNGSKQEHIDLWKKVSEGLKTFIENFDEQNIASKLGFKRLNGEAYSMPHHEIFAHVFNHSTFHRGQLVTMFRQVGFTNVQSTDLLNFYHTK